MKKPVNAEKWGRAAATKRYGSVSKKADGGELRPPEESSDYVPEAQDQTSRAVQPSNDDSVFNIEGRDYGKEPASLGEKIVGTAKMVAEPYARTIRNAYRTFSGEKNKKDGGRLDKKARGGKVTKKADGGSAAKKGGSPTSSKTATKTATSTKTSTVANPKNNITVTGGAGDGDTKVTIGKGKAK